MLSTWSKVCYADKDCPETIPRDHALKDPKQTQDWRTVETPKEITNYLMLRNKRNFGQTHGAMFILPPLSHEIDRGTNSISLKLLLEGTYK
eukprot:15332236-Ditylum_brightwellii.AAC.1